MMRKGSLVTMLRPYAVDPTVDGSPSIACGAVVRVVAMRRTAFGCRVYDVTDGTVTIAGVPRHAIKEQR